MQALACTNWQDMPCRAFSETNLNVKIGFWLALHDSKAIFLHPAGMDKNNVTAPHFDTGTNLTPRVKKMDFGASYGAKSNIFFSKYASVSLPLTLWAYS